MKRALYVGMAALAVAVGLYPAIYFVIDRPFGLLQSKTADLLASPAWNVGFYTHILCGGLALLVGWAQFGPTQKRLTYWLHRTIGYIYAYAVLASGLAGLFIGLSATGGIIAKAGFISLGIIWLGTTAQGVRQAKAGKIGSHTYWMTLSYAACLSAVTLRIWLPLLIINLGSFIPAYRIVAWLCWVPNLAVGYWLPRRRAAHATLLPL